MGRDTALTKITHVRPNCPNTEFVLVVIPRPDANPYPQNLNPGVASLAVAFNAMVLARPHRGPYIGYCPIRRGRMQSMT